LVTVPVKLVRPLTVSEVSVPTLVSDEAVTPDASVAPVKVPAAAGTVMLADPLNDTPLMLRAVARVVAVEALPVSAAVIVPAVKFPLASRETIVLAVFALVAVVDVLGIAVLELNTSNQFIPVVSRVSVDLNVVENSFPPFTAPL
jgi:hypothetical protein